MGQRTSPRQKAARETGVSPTPAQIASEQGFWDATQPLPEFCTQE